MSSLLEDDSPSVYKVLALLCVRMHMVRMLQSRELAALAVATTSSEHGRGDVGDRVKVEASSGAALVCSGSWLWEVVPWRAGMWTGAMPWEGEAVKRVTWTKAAEGQWVGQWGHCMVAVPNERAEVGYTLMVVGGAGRNFDPTDSRFVALRDVHTSDDGGIVWRMVHGSAPFSARSEHAMVVVPHVHRSPHVVVMTGGVNTEDCIGDVWRGAADGNEWKRMTSAMECGTRLNHVMCVMPGVEGGPAEILLVGGKTDRSRNKDCWVSDDMGRSWRRVCEEVRQDGRDFISMVSIPDGTIAGACRTLVVCSGDAGLQMRVSTDRGHSWQEVPMEWPLMRASAVYAAKLHMIPRVGGGGDAVLALGVTYGMDCGKMWICKGGAGQRWTWTDAVGDGMWDDRWYHSSAVVSGQKSGTWEVVVAGGGLDPTMSDVWRGTLHA